MDGVRKRFAAIVIAACAIFMGAVLGFASFDASSDPYAAYRDPARTAAIRAVVVQSDPAGLLVRYLDTDGQELRAALSGTEALEPGWHLAHPVGMPLDVVAMSGRPGAPVVPRALLDTPAPEEPSPIPRLVAAVAGVGGGLLALRAIRRITWDIWLRWHPGVEAAGMVALPRSGRRSAVFQAAITPQGRAVTRRAVAGALMVVALPLLAVGLPPLTRTTRDAFASLNWPTAPGTVIEARLRLWHSNGPSDATEWVARVVFAYEVDGRRYTVETPEWSIIQAGWGANAEEVVARYPRGTRLPVHYDPARPWHAVLRPGPLPVTTAVFCGLAAMAVLGWLWGVRVLLRPLPPAGGGASPTSFRQAGSDRPGMA